MGDDAPQDPLDWTESDAASFLFDKKEGPRYLRMRLHEELARFRRTARPVSLLFVKLRSPLDVADGQVVSSLVRCCDLVTRWAEDVFAVVLTETDGATAAEVAERLIERLRRRHANPENLLRMGRATVTADDTPDGLLDRCLASLQEALDADIPVPVHQSPAATNDDTIGHEAELRHLAQDFEEALQGHPWLTVLQTAPWLDAERLTLAHARQLRTQYRCRVLCGKLTSKALPGTYQAIEEALTKELLASSYLFRELREELTADELGLLSTLFPLCSRLRPKQLRGTFDTRDHLMVGTALNHLLAVLAQHSPLLLVLENFHLASVEAWECLAYLARNLGEAKIQILVTVDSKVKLDGWSALTFNALVQARNCSHVELKPFSLKQTERVLRHRIGSISSPFVGRFHDLSGGSPRLTSMMLRLLDPSSLPEEPAPDTFLPHVAHILDAMLRSCRSKEQRVLLCGAILGSGWCEAELAALLQWPESSAQSAIVTLLEKQILIRRQEDKTLSFINELTRERILRKAKQEDRKALHLRAADLLLAEHQEPPPLIASKLYRHFREAGDEERAHQYAVTAGKSAVAAQEFSSAQKYLGAAVSLRNANPSFVADGRAMAVALQLADAQIATGDLEPAQQTLQRTLETSDAIHHPLLSRRLAKLLAIQGRYCEALELIARLKPLAVDHPLEQAALLADESHILRLLGRYTSSLVAAFKSLQLLEDGASHSLPAMCNMAAVSLALGRLERALAQFQRILSLAEQVEEDTVVSFTLAYQAIAQRRLSQTTAARQQLQSLLEEQDSPMLPELEALLLSHLLDLDLETNNTETCPSMASRLTMLLDRISHRQAIGARLALSQWELSQERREQAFQLARSALQQAEDAGDRLSMGQALFKLGEMGRHQQGDAEQSRKLVVRAIRILGEAAPYHQTQARLLLCEMLLEAGDAPGASRELLQVRRSFEQLKLPLPYERLKGFRIRLTRLVSSKTSGEGTPVDPPVPEA